MFHSEFYMISEQNSENPESSDLSRVQLPISLCTLYILVLPPAWGFLILMTMPPPPAFRLFLKSVPLYPIPWPSRIPPPPMHSQISQLGSSQLDAYFIYQWHQIGLFPEHKRAFDQEQLIFGFSPSPRYLFLYLVCMSFFYCLCSILCNHVIGNSGLTQ